MRSVGINQNDDREKQWQVQQMYNIYHSALFESVWLDPASDDIDISTEQMERTTQNLARQRPYLESIERIFRYVQEKGLLDEFLSISAFSSFIRRS